MSSPATEMPSPPKAIPIAPATPIETHWTQIAAKMKEKWTALTEDDLKFVDKNMAALVAKVKERTGLEVETAERQLDALIATVVAPA